MEQIPDELVLPISPLLTKRYSGRSKRIKISSDVRAHCLVRRMFRCQSMGRRNRSSPQPYRFPVRKQCFFANYCAQRLQYPMIHGAYQSTILFTSQDDAAVLCVRYPSAVGRTWNGVDRRWTDRKRRRGTIVSIQGTLIDRLQVFNGDLQVGFDYISDVAKIVRVDGTLVRSS